MQRFALTDKATRALPVSVVAKASYKKWLGAQPAHTQSWLKSIGFEAGAGETALVPGERGALARVIVGEHETALWTLAHLPHTLPKGTYHLESAVKAALATEYAAGWALGAYRFTKYQSKSKQPAMLALPKQADKKRVEALAGAFYLARDLINMPANDLLPTQLAKACEQFARDHKATSKTITGEALLKQNYPTIYTVGKGSDDAPRLVDIRHGKAGAPKVTLVGKGVCFDSGGLDLKPSSAMRLMKKDMGGAAAVLALARMIILSGINVNLRVLCPLVENAVSGRAMRPLDVVKTRKGITVEIGNTDAEGRLILSDALAEADREKPDLLIDCATLTGAARVALGTDIPAFFTPDDKLAAAVAKHSAAQDDPMYRLPLHAPYRDMIKGKVADISNDTESSYAGSITAALFLKEFVEHTRSWLHVDMMAWNLASRPGRPAGGEAQTVRALFALIEERYK